MRDTFTTDLRAAAARLRDNDTLTGDPVTAVANLLDHIASEYQTAPPCLPECPSADHSMWSLPTAHDLARTILAGQPAVTG